MSKRSMMHNTEKKYIDIGIPFSYWEKEIEVVSLNN